MRFFLIISMLFSQLFVMAADHKCEIQAKFVSFGHKAAENRNIDVIIIHSVYNASGGDIYDVDLIIKQFAKYKVSPHYLIDRQGVVYQMVNEKNIAFHAGKSVLPDGSTGINNRSIGIEIITSLEEAPTDKQIQSAVQLVIDIKNRYKIKYVLRHSDIAPNRKTDPWNLDWNGFLEKINGKINGEIE